MKQRSRARRTWRVGELAQATGLTVRTLHHYEHVRLLSPGSRTEAGHRVYDEDDLRRLYQVCALRDIGLALPEIRRVLDDKPSLVKVLRAHSLRVEAELTRLSRLQTQLRHAGEHAGSIGADEVVRRGEARRARSV